jgi:hypothetical protein
MRLTAIQIAASVLAITCVVSIFGGALGDEKLAARIPPDSMRHLLCQSSPS